MIHNGDWAAIALRRGVSGLFSYVGQVQDVDSDGIHMTLIDWLTGDATGWDFWTPWSNIDGIEFATSQHDIAGFVDSAKAFQQRCDQQHGPR